MREQTHLLIQDGGKPALFFALRKQGRLEVTQPGVANQWGTVCGHWLWDNDNAATIACRANGFAGGSIYTFGATTTLPVLPIAYGYRSCTGTEQNLFQCPQCGNRLAQNGNNPIDPSTGQQVCSPGPDGTQHCCSWEGGQEAADALSGCTHSVDQGVICYTAQEMQDQQTNRMNSAVPCTPTFNSPCPDNPEQLEQ